MTKKVGILLAGGMSRRYGSQKAFAKVEGAFFYEKSYAALQAVCDHVVVVTREELFDLFPIHYTLLTDMEPYVGCGPLAGIYTAMMHTDAEQYVVLPCDMPLIHPNIMKHLLTRHQTEITVVEVASRLQPLVSVWNRSTKKKIAFALQKKQYRMRDVFDISSIIKVDGESLTDHLEVFMNINTLEQDKEMRKWLES